MADIPSFEDFKKQSSIPSFEDFKAQGAGPELPRVPMPVPQGLRRIPDNFWTSPNGLIRSGLRQAGEGALHMVQPGSQPKYAGASDILEGIGKAALPAAIPAAVAAPIPAIGSALLGAGGAALGGLGARAIGASPEASRLSGDVGGIVGAMAGGPGLSRALRVDPRIAVNRVLRPIPSDPGFPERIPETIGAIKATNPGFKPTVENGEFNLVPAAQKAITAHQETLNPWMQRAEGQRFSGAPIVEATREATGRMLPSEQQSAESLIARAQHDYGRDFTPQELRDRLTLLNQRIAPLYNRSPSVQSSALADIPEAVLKAQRDATADTLYRGLDPENEGAGPRLIQSRTGDLIDLRDAAMRRSNDILAKEPLTPLGRVVDPLKGFIRGLIPGHATGAGLAFAGGPEGRGIPMLRRAFNAVPEAEAANSFGALPRPGPRAIAAASDTSGPLPAAVRDFSSVGSEFEPQVRMLPAASSQIGVSGTTVPDIYGQVQQAARNVITRPQLPSASFQGRITPVPVSRGGFSRLLPPPDPGQPPINMLPRGPGAIGPAGTVPEFSAESPIKSGGILGGKRLLDYLGPRRLPPDIQP